VNSLTNGPLVSVVVPAFNASATIREALESVLAQSYRNVEVIVVDDGSTDDTAEIAEAFVCRDARLRVIRQPNGGVASARNRGLCAAKGKYFAPIDSDDLWDERNLSRQVHALETSMPPALFSFAASFIVDEEGRRRDRRPRPSARSDYVGLLRRNWVGNGSAAVFRRDAVVEVGGYDETLRARGAEGAEDWKLALRLAAQVPGIAIPDELVGYRHRPGSMSMDPVAMTRSTMIVIDEMRRTGPRIAPWNFWHARTTIHIGMFYRWIYAGRPLSAMWCFAQAYLANPLWFTQRGPRDFLFKELMPHLMKRCGRLVSSRGG